TRVVLNGTESSQIDLKTPSGEVSLTLKVPGLYNVYNALAAASTAVALGISLEDIEAGIESFTAAFGRIERVNVPGADNKSLFMALVKNPVGFNEVLRMLFDGGEGSKHLLIIINDLTADGRDVSWLWDV